MGRSRLGIHWLALVTAGLLACNGSGVPPTGNAADLTFVPPPAEDLAVAAPDMTTGEDLAMCPLQPLAINPRQLPLDVVLVVDNTLKASDARDIELNFNANLTQLLDRVGLDYRLLLMTSFGDWWDSKVCIGKPATKNDCMQFVKGPPKDGQHVFHYDLNVDPIRFESDLLATFRKPDVWNLVPNGWGGWLRKEARKAMVLVSATGLVGSATQLDLMLRAMDPAQFGNAQLRTYRTDVIGGMAAPPGGLLPNAPVANMLCGAKAVAAGEEDQRWSILTGGTRWQICDGFDTNFRLLAQQLINQVRTPCEAELEKPALGKVVTDSVALQFVPGMGNPLDLVQVKDAGSCVANGFYFDGGFVVFCPAICNQIDADRQGTLTARACVGP